MAYLDTSISRFEHIGWLLRETLSVSRNYSNSFILEGFNLRYSWDTLLSKYCSIIQYWMNQCIYKNFIDFCSHAMEVGGQGEVDPWNFFSLP